MSLLCHYYHTSIFVDSDNKIRSFETPNKESNKSIQTDDPKKVLKNLSLKNVNRYVDMCPVKYKFYKKQIRFAGLI